MDLTEKFQKLKNNLKNMGNVVIAFSGGVDSTFLLKVAYDVLGNNVIAVTSQSSLNPQREFLDAKAFTDTQGINHISIHSNELDVDGFAENPTNRCYLCKKELFIKIKQIAKENAIKYVLEGSNSDDLNDYRPGMLAINELGILSPLKESGLTKNEIRILSKQLGLKTWDKPSFACLASRFPYGQKITKEKLATVDKSEEFLLDLGFKQVRVRHHGDIARLEVSQEEMQKFLNIELMQKVHDRFKELGFTYTALDLKGYRTGSMNENLEI